MHILDLYDDPSASVLRAHLSRDSLPVKLAAMQVDDAESLQKLPDRLFALVGTVGGEPLRKYAMHDAPHLATSIAYFLRCGGALEQPVRAKVAQNLLTACSWYDTEPPEALQKIAMVGALVNTGLTAMAVPEKVRQVKSINQAEDSALRSAQMAGVKHASHVRKTYSAEEAYRELDDFITGNEKPEECYRELGGEQYPNPFADGPGIEVAVKKADLRGTEMGSAPPAGSADPRGPAPQKRFAMAAKVSEHQGAGELRFLEAPSKQAAAKHYALPHKQLYPIDTPEQVKRASAYYDEYHRELTAVDRRLFASVVYDRAEQLGVKLAGWLPKVAGDTYGPHIRSELLGRIAALEGTEKSAAYEVMLERLDEVPPIVMYDLLKKADEENKLDAGYGRPVTGFREPLSAVFGAPEKPIYTWADDGHYVTEEMLRSFIKRGPDLDRVFGDGFSTKFIADPVKEFDKLTNDKKIVIARLANQEAFRLY